MSPRDLERTPWASGHAAPSFARRLRFWLLLLALGFALMAQLGGCTAPGFGTGFEAHDLDLGARRIGTRQTITIVIDWQRADIARASCARFIKGSDAMACAVWPSGGRPLTPAETAVMAGADCRIFMPPNRFIAGHELTRCIGREDYRVGIMQPVDLAVPAAAPARSPES